MISSLLKRITTLFSSRDAERDYGVVTAIAGVFFVALVLITIGNYLPQAAPEAVVVPPPPVPVTDADFQKMINIYSARVEAFQAGSFPFLKLPDPSRATAPKK